LASFEWWTFHIHFENKQTNWQSWKRKKEKQKRAFWLRRCCAIATMAATEAPSNEEVYKVPLKVFVDRNENKVLFAEARKDFVDVLLSFLALPLGTIARLVAKESNIPPVKVGSLSSLYESVSHIEEQHLWTKTCKEMLLHPRTSMESYCQLIKLNIDDTQPTKYFLCEDLGCSRKTNGSLLSIFNNQRCSCGKLMNRIVYPEVITLQKGFVKETATFIICDDLSVLPNVLVTIVNLLQNLGVKDMGAIEEQTVDISKREVCYIAIRLLLLVLLLSLSDSLFGFCIGCWSSQVVVDIKEPFDRFCLWEETTCWWF